MIDRNRLEALRRQSELTCACVAREGAATGEVSRLMAEHTHIALVRLVEECRLFVQTHERETEVLHTPGYTTRQRVVL